MGRVRSDYICPKCNKKGYLEHNPTRNGEYPNAKTRKYLRVVHYDSITKTRSSCYIDNIINKQHKGKKTISVNDNLALSKSKLKNITEYYDKNKKNIYNKNKNSFIKHIRTFENMSFTELQDYALSIEKKSKIITNEEKEAIELVAIKRKIPLPRYKKVSAEVPPPNLQGESELYYKIKDLSDHFFKIGRKLKKIQKDIYQFKPNEKISAQCVNDLDEFETKLLIPLEKLLVPYDKRWMANWTKWIKIQLDNLLKSSRYTAKLHARPTGEFGIITNKEGKTVFVKIEGSMTSKQIKKNQKKILEYAYQLILTNPLERALTNWSYNTKIETDDKKISPTTMSSIRK